MNTRRLDVIWLFLLCATALSWWVGERGASGFAVALGLLALAGLKGGLVILDFMGLRQVKFFWPALLLGWLLFVLALIALAYRMGMT